MEDVISDVLSYWIDVLSYSDYFIKKIYWHKSKFII
jgi:hypothetical protein